MECSVLYTSYFSWVATKYGNIVSSIGQLFVNISNVYEGKKPILKWLLPCGV